MNERRSSVRSTRAQFCLAVGVAMIATGCLGRSPDVRHYLLGTSMPGGGSSSTRDVAVLVGPVRMPSYLERSQIARLESNGEIELDETNRWLGGFEENFLRALTSGLARKLGSVKIVQHPSRAPFSLDYRVQLHVDDLIDVTGEALRVRIRWSLQIEGAEEPAEIFLMQETVPIESGGSRGVVEAHDVALDRLAQSIATAISVK